MIGSDAVELVTIASFGLSLLCWGFGSAEAVRFLQNRRREQQVEKPALARSSAF